MPSLDRLLGVGAAAHPLLFFIWNLLIYLVVYWMSTTNMVPEQGFHAPLGPTQLTPSSFAGPRIFRALLRVGNQMQGPRRPTRMTWIKRQSLCATLLLLLGLPACGSSDAAGSSGSRDAAGSLHQVGPRDSGELVKLTVGDRLVVSLDNMPQATWRLVGYPHGMLELAERHPRQSRYAFEAMSPGRGSLTLRLAQYCGPPLLRPCRMGKSGGADSGRPPLFGRAYRLDVHVLSGAD